MGRTSDRKKKRRDISTPIAKRSLPVSVGFVPYNPVSIRTFEDRREFHPDGGRRPPKDIYGRIRKISPVTRARTKSSPALGFRSRTEGPVLTTVFEMPKETAICVRRKRRREVILATGKGGRRKRRRPRYNEYSTVRCRRK